MKTILLNILLTLTIVQVASAQFTTNTASAATNTIALSSAPPANFLATVQSYLTSVDTNFTWTSNRLEAAAGADYQGGIQWANYVSAQADLHRYDLEAKVRNVGLGGVIESFEAGGGYTVIQDHSLKIQASLLAGYDLTRHAALVEPQAVLKKKTTPNTYLELGIGLPVWIQNPVNQRPNFFIGAGFTY